MEAARRARTSTRSVLLTDVALHGRRFIAVEFKIAAALSAALAATTVATRPGWLPTVAGFVFFAGVSVNSWSVVRWVSGYHGPGQRSAGIWDLALFAALTLIPGALAATVGEPPGSQ